MTDYEIFWQNKIYYDHELIFSQDILIRNSRLQISTFYVKFMFDILNEFDYLM